MTPHRTEEPNLGAIEVVEVLRGPLGLPEDVEIAKAVTVMEVAEVMGDMGAMAMMT